MSSNYGVQTVYQGGYSMRVAVEPKAARWKPGGVTIDWTTVAANNADTTLPNGQIVKAGTKYLRYGQVLGKITASGKYGPIDTTANDGREVVAATVRGDAFVLDRTVTEDELGSAVIGNVLDGGQVFKGRLLIGGAGQPTEAQFETMFPGITFHND